MTANSSRRLPLIIIVFIARFRVPGRRVFNLPSHARMLSRARSGRAFYFRAPCPFSSLSLSLFRFLFSAAAASLVLFFFLNARPFSERICRTGKYLFCPAMRQAVLDYFAIESHASRCVTPLFRVHEENRRSDRENFHIAPRSPFVKICLFFRLSDRLSFGRSVGDRVILFTRIFRAYLCRFDLLEKINNL